MTKRQFGTIRKLSSGRWQASYWHEAGRHFAPRTFTVKAEASAWLAEVETAVARGAWIDPRAGDETFANYARRWLDQRHDLRPSTRDDYESQLSVHLLPAFGEFGLGAINPAAIRSWFSDLARRSPGRAAKCYRLLRTILNTAEIDRVIAYNPCRIRGAGTERVVERVIPTLEETEKLADAMPERLRLLVVVATWCGLRRGELLALRRTDVDLSIGAVRVERSAFQMRDGTIIYGPPKTAAGTRIVRWPPNLQDQVERHLRRFVGAEPDALVFTGEKGGPLRQHVLQAAWRKACISVGVSYRVHDLRHLGATLAATTGASTKEIMRRIGHSSPAAALRYQHATEDRDAAIAAALAALASPTDPGPGE
jgi:integrase